MGEMPTTLVATVGGPPPDADQSYSLAKLADALSKAQGKIHNASKDRTNPHFNSSYATLASVWDAIRAPLSENGLAVVQRVSTTAKGVLITTELLHSSGEFIRSRMEVPAQKLDAQGLGSATSYGRRYSLMAMVGVASDDDDGNDATGPQPSRGQAPKSSGPQTKAAKAADARAEAISRPNTVVDVLPGESEASAKLRSLGEWSRRAIKAGQDAGWEPEDVKNWLKAEFKCGRPTEVAESHLAAFLKNLGPADAGAAQ